MSVSINVQGSLGNPKTVTLGSSEGDVYAPSGSSFDIVIGILLCNTSSSAVICTLYWSDGSTSYAFWKGSVAANSTTDVGGLPLRLQADGGTGVAVKIRGIAATGAVVNATVNYTTISGFGSRGG